MVAIIFLALISLVVIFVFNPMNSRDKLIKLVLNSYLSSNIEGYQSLPKDAPAFEERSFDHPILNDTQEKILYDLGVDTSKLPTEITESAQKCFVDKLGEKRAEELVGGASPSSIEIYNIKDCLGE